MLLETGDGIRCDLCNLSARHRFTYFSYDILELQFDKLRLEPIQYSKKPHHSFDLCGMCDEKYRQTVIHNFKPLPCNSGSYPNGIMCELSGNIITDKQTVYYAIVTKVTVEVDQNQVVCRQCKTVNQPNTQCKKCKGTIFDRHTQVNSQPRDYEFVICAETFSQLKSKITKLSNIPEANLWA